MKKITLDSKILNIWQEAESDFSHPLLRKVRFVLTDDRPNANNQGIEHEDFELLKMSAIDMPIKMRFIGDDVLGHKGAITIGHIRAVSEEEEDGIHKLVAEGVLYADEYPNEVQFLEQKFATRLQDPAAEAPGISWEINYKDEKKQGAISWLKGAITKAATFVKNPAYGARTAILAIASDNSLSDDDLIKEISTIAEKYSPKNDEEGGNNKVEEELKKLQEQLAALQKELEEVKTAKSELEAKVTAQSEVIATYERATLIADRTKKATEAGLKVEGEKLEKKQEFWATLSEEAFNEYLADIATASKNLKAQASVTSGGLPKIDPPADDEETVTLSELRTKMRTLGRS